MVKCAKCKQVELSGPDSWCLACGAWEALETELGARWHNPALRGLAEDTVIAAVRTVRGLRTLGASLDSAERARASDRGSSARGRSAAEPVRERPPLPVPPPPPVPVKEQEESIEAEDEESEEEADERNEEELATATPKSKASRRPSEPSRPPREDHRDRSRDRSRRSHKEKPRGHKKKRKNTSHRGGRKHQRLYRSLENPNINLHRKIPASFWDKRPSLDGRPALPRKK